MKFFTSMHNFFDSVNSNTLIVAIRRGLTLMIPFMIMGSFAVFINNLPISAYQSAMVSLFGEGWTNFNGYIWQATFGVMSICITLSVGYSLTENRKDKSFDIPPMMGALVSLSSFFVLIYAGDGQISQDWIGPLGVFIAITTAFVATNCYIFLCRIRYFRIKLFSNAAESHFTTVMASLFPVFLTVIFFAAFRIFLSGRGIENIHAAMYEALREMFMNMPSEFSTGIAFVTLTHVFWFLGIHGNNVLEPVAQSVLTPAMDTNIALAAQGLPPTEIFTKQFFDVFVFLGGSGATLCLIIALFIGMKRSNTSKVAAISILPGLINVNEVMIYGVPIVLNFYLLIPFVLLPPILTVISYAAMSLGLVPLTTAAVEWTTPIFIGGYIVTGGSFAGTVLQFVNLLVGTLIYLPFVGMYERSLNRDNNRTLGNLMSEVLKLSELRQIVLLNRKDSEGNMARALAGDLTHAVRGNGLHLQYQPLVRDDKVVFGVEALLRWKHDRLGNIPPPVTIAIAEEAGLIHELGLWIFKTALQVSRNFTDQGLKDIIVSINITPSQLDHPTFIEDIKDMLQQFSVNPRQIDIEITEQAALGGIGRIEVIQELKKLGLNIAMDDFGMGHGSLMYLKDFNLDVIKIDGSLVSEIETNVHCRDIISTIVRLCRSMDIQIIAEYVENENQRELLLELGCTCYQGYLYSPALHFDEAVEYIRKSQKEDKKSDLSNEITHTAI